MMVNSLTQVQWEALHEVVQGEYKLGSDGLYMLQHDGVKKLTASLDTKDKLLSAKQAELDVAKQRASAFEGMDPERIHALIEQEEASANQKLLDKGNFDKALANEKKRSSEALAVEKDLFTSERAYTSSLLVDKRLANLLSSGTYGDETLPQVRPALLAGLTNHLKSAFNPRVEVGEDGKARKAVVTVDGIDQDLDDHVVAWMRSKEAADWMAPTGNSGGHDKTIVKQNNRPAGAKEPRQIMRSDTESINANIGDIASGAAVVVDDG